MLTSVQVAQMYFSKKETTTMPLSKKQIKALLQYVAKAEHDAIDCDGCYGQVAEFSEAQLEGVEIPQALEAVELHLRQCICCKDEFESLIDGLHGLTSA